MGKYLVPNAMRTGNWSLVEEAQASRDQILDLGWWETVASWSPISPIIGIPRKIQGGIDAAKSMDKVIEDLRFQQENGLDEAAMRVKRLQEEQEDYNQNRENNRALDRLEFEWEQEERAAARAAVKADERQQRNENADFWAAERAKRREEEAKDRIAIAKFWMEYRKQIAKIQQESRPSKLVFGFI